MNQETGVFKASFEGVDETAQIQVYISVLIRGEDSWKFLMSSSWVLKKQTGSYSFFLRIAGRSVVVTIESYVTACESPSFLTLCELIHCSIEPERKIK